MSDHTAIEWADASWNPTPRCTEIAPQVVDPRGYVLVRLPHHAQSDVRGYVYQHRLVMEQALGRPLARGERVRHRDNNPGNNAVANLVLVPPLDRDAMTICACGCGTKMTVLDSSGRARRFVSGHNSVRRAASHHRPRAETGAGLSEEVKEYLIDLFNGLCAYGCGRPATQWDHLIAWCEGGTFAAAGNAVPACRPCNTQKSGSSDPWPWIDRAMASNQAGAWVDLIGLAVDHGQLEVSAR